MSDMETQVHALARLRNAGYAGDFVVFDDGMIGTADRRYSADLLTIDHLLRFEGMSDPADESMLLAVATPDGHKGTLTLPYGPSATSAQVEAVTQMCTMHRDSRLMAPEPEPNPDAHLDTGPPPASAL